MIVLILERVPAGLRGELSRWMLEPKTNVFVGKLTAIVRDRLWQKAAKDAKGGAGILVYASQNEQGFTVNTFGDTTRAVMDWEGLLLVHVPKEGQEVAIRKREMAPRIAAPAKPPPLEPDPDDPFRDE